MENYLPQIVNAIFGIVLALWIYRDAKGRDFNPVIWALSALLTSVFLLPILGPILIVVFYLLLRPKGNMRSCPHCHKRYLTDYASCPHCRRATKKDCHRCREVVYVAEPQCPSCKTKL